MLENFFSVEYANRGDLFEKLFIWQEESYQKLQGTSPVLSLSFANIKEKDYETTKWKICQFIKDLYELAFTNYEVKRMFYSIVRGWFKSIKGDYNDFVKALLQDDIEEMNLYMNRITKTVFSYFDTAKTPSESEPEKFYHGFVLGLMTELVGEYVLTSNRESGFGRYDVMLEPIDKNKNAIIIEFKVHNPKKEKSLEETVEIALKQIQNKQYEASLITKGIKIEHIKKYGFAFEGKMVLIG